MMDSFNDMNFNLDDMVEYPDYGKIVMIDDGDGYSDGTQTVVYDGICDIQMKTVEIGQIASESNYIVVIPMPKDAKGVPYNPIRRDMKFYGVRFGEQFGDVNNIESWCRVMNAEPSQLGGIVVYINRITW